MFRRSIKYTQTYVSYADKQEHHHVRLAPLETKQFPFGIALAGSFKTKAEAEVYADLVDEYIISAFNLPKCDIQKWVVGPELKPWRKQKEWLTPELLHSAPSAEFISVDGNNGAQLSHPKGGPLGWVRCPNKDAVGVAKVDGKWHWLLPNKDA